MQVERLTVQFSSDREEEGDWGGNSPTLAPLVFLIRQCAASLRTLNLRGIPFDELFDVRISNRARGDPEVLQPLLVRHALRLSMAVLMHVFESPQHIRATISCLCGEHAWQPQHA